MYVYDFKNILNIKQVREGRLHGSFASIFHQYRLIIAIDTDHVTEHFLRGIRLGDFFSM